jgi:DNA-binding NarL/FixJ family response regulator
MVIEKLSPLLKQKARIKEIRSVDRKVLRPDLAQLFSDAIRASKAFRERAMRAGYFENGYRQKEIADHLGLHDTTVRNIFRKIR